MAEFAASIIALVGIAGTTLQVSAKLMKLSKDIKYAKTDIKSFSTDMDLFGNEIKFARKVLIRQSRNPLSTSVFEYLERRIMLGLVRKSEFVEKSIEDVVPKIESLKSRLDIVAGMKWVFFNKDNIQGIRSQMDSVRASLTHIMLSVKLDVTCRGPQTREAQQEIKYLKSQIQHQSKTIIKLVELLDFQNSNNKSSGFIPPPNDEQVDALLDLGTSLIKDGVVPSPERVVRSPEIVVRSPESSPSRNSIYQHRNQNLPLVIVKPSQRDSGIGWNPSSSIRSRHSKLIRLTEAHRHPPITIPLRTDNGVILNVEGLADKGVTENFVSRNFAGWHQFQIMKLSDRQSDTWVELNGKEHRCVGTINIVWHRNVDIGFERESFLLQCFVCEEPFPNFIFGKFFLDEHARLA